MPISYTHRQFSRATVVSLLAMAGVFVAVLAASTTRHAIATNRIVAIVITASALLALAAHLVMLSLTVNVSDHELSWNFGLGFWKKRILRSDITRVRRIRLPWWYGIGIKSATRGWVYLVSPGDGVEVALINGEAVQIGTDDAEGLMMALSQHS